MESKSREQLMRDGFEAWAKKQRLGLAYGDCGYVFSSTEMAWRAWQASREVFEVELPESFYPDGDIECPKVVNLYEVIEALSAAGITVKGDE